MVNLKINIPSDFLKEEVRDGYVISSEKKKIWAVQLDLVCELLSVCDKYGLTIYPEGGTLLGAVRHKGYIPWDDDIDFMMNRRDYNQLCKIAPFAFKHPYFFQTEITDPGSIYLHAKLRNSATTGILSSQYSEKFGFNQGIFIDIFPYDNVPDDEIEQELFVKKIDRLRIKTYNYSCYIYRNQIFGNGLKAFLKRIVRLFCICFLPKNIFYCYLQWASGRYFGKSKIVGSVSYSGLDANLYNQEWFEKSINVPFEFLSIKIPFMSGEILKKAFGEWEKPVMGGSEHGDVIYDVEKPYTLYLK